MDRFGSAPPGVQMPEATKDIHDSRDLDASVSALIGDLEAAAREQGVPAAPPAAPAPALSASKPLAAAPEVPAEPPAPDLAQAVEKLLAESQPAPAAAAPTHQPPASTRIDSLDAELAGLADDLITGEFAAEAEPPQRAPPVPAAAPVVPPPATKPAAKPAPAPVARPAKPVEATPPAPPEPKPAPKPAPRGPSPLLRAVAALSSPLRNKPQHVRDAVGWMATVNAFLALCVWGYLLLLRPAEAPLPKPVAHSTTETSRAKDAGHGKEAAAKEAKKPAKADAHAKEKTTAKKPAPKSGGH